MDLEIDACGRGEGKVEMPRPGWRAHQGNEGVAWQVKDCLANGSLATDMGVRNTLEASCASTTAKR
jgi:hypothetical protein